VSFGEGKGKGYIEMTCIFMCVIHILQRVVYFIIDDGCCCSFISVTLNLGGGPIVGEGKEGQTMP
jgi:hypothetical protein